MKKSIGMIEYKSIAKGIESTDAMLKAANVQLLLSAPQCPGKYISIIGGEVGAVQSAIKAGLMVADVFAIEDYIIPNVNEGVFPALSATATYDCIESLGIIETISAVSSIMTGDIAAKAANVKLVDIRIAMGLGGKGYTIFTGELAAVKAALAACDDKMKQGGVIISSVLIASPTEELIAAVV